MSAAVRSLPVAGLVVALLLFSAAAASEQPPAASLPRYATDAGRKADAPLNVHIVCHSHDDAGWLKTVDQYYYGANNTIQVAGVQYILDTVVQALQANPHRKFVYAEMAFFTRWWAQQDEDMRAAVSQLVRSGQLEFVNGGYVQHDEATAHYVGMIDQTTRGHRFLQQTFGAIPRVGWQIDPFGHSSTQAGLLSAQVGFDALFFGRADYQDMEHRRGRDVKAMEVVWRGSASLQDATVFAGNLPSGNYGPPPGFAYEWADPPVMDDPRLDEYNVQERVDAFVAQCREQANVTRGGDIMLTIGSDFQFANAHLQFKNLDKLIHHVNADGRVNAFYSTPARYVAAKHGYGARWPLKEDDFFPYADFPHAFWTGYFTSRPTSKGYVRAATSYLQGARQLEAFVGLPRKEGGPTTEALEEAVSLLQHHDAVTGTAKQHVANDYHRRVHRGLKEAQAVVTSALDALIRGKYKPSGGPLSGGAGSSAGGGALASQRRRLQAAAQAQGGMPNPVDAPIGLEVCDWLNVTACNATVRMSAAGQGVLVAAYNPLGWSREVALRVPVSTAATCTWTVKGPEGEDVAAQLVPADTITLALQQLLASINATCPTTFGDAEVTFIARLPPLGYSTFFLQPIADSSAGGCQQMAGTAASAAAPIWPKAAPRNQQRGSKESMLDNGLVRLDFDTSTGLLARMSVGAVSARLTTSFAWYNSSDGLDSEENRGQASGAYIFRPNGLYNITGTGKSGPAWRSLWQRIRPTGSRPVARLSIVHGDTVSEARQEFGEWATLVTRLYRGQSHVELEWTVGPIPFEDGLGREVVLLYTSDVESGDEFWTDANGREMIKRVRDFRPTWKLNQTEPTAGNYYPLTAAMYIQDGSRQLAVLTDRAQGGASLRSGQMEVMVHRRTLKDDWRGVAEPMNETACGCTNCACPGKPRNSQFAICIVKTHPAEIPSCSFPAHAAGLVARGRHWLVLAALEEAARPRRTLQLELDNPPLLSFAPIPHHIGSADKTNGRVGLRRTFSLSEGHILHNNVHLLTLKDTGSSYLVRLAHLYQAREEDEGPGLSSPITENLNAVLQLLQYQEVRELSLSANQLRSQMQQDRLRFEAGNSLGISTGLGLRTAASRNGTELARLRAGAHLIDCREDCVSGQLLITLQPMEIRTFELLYRPY
ncbi:hypothetical protein ABPG77_005710 [Micractinium sp. CCAP 211/92]